MELPDHDGLGYPARPSGSEHHRPRTLQRHHTIQNSDDAYVSWSPTAANSKAELCPVGAPLLRFRPEATSAPGKLVSESPQQPALNPAESAFQLPAEESVAAICSLVLVIKLLPKQAKLRPSR